MNKTGVFNHGLIWFGAAVSVAEIEAGLQSGGNWTALVLGHLLGGVLLFAAGLLGARTGENAMETTRRAFGGWGMRLFALLNVLQLVGWTTVMIAQGSAAASALAGGWSPIGCAVVLGVLVAAWVLIGLDDTHRIATGAMALLAVLSVFLTVRLIGLPSVETGAAEPLGFWPAFELSVAMPLSWLPLVSDYTRRATRPIACTAASAGVYTLVSIWMYALGILLTSRGQTSLTTGILACGLGMAGLVVVVISTVTTTFLDAYSAGESSRVFSSRLKPKAIGVAVCALGTVLAWTGIVDRYVGFLCLIASVFAPMAAVLLVNCFVVRRSCPCWNAVAWLVGTLMYHYASGSPIGPTLTALLVSGGLALMGRLCRRFREEL